MDYKKITKKELMEECKKRKIDFSPSWTRDKLENALIDFDKSSKKEEKIESKEKTVEKVSEQKTSLVEEPKEETKEQNNNQSSNSKVANILGLIGGIALLIGAIMMTFFFSVDMGPFGEFNMNLFQFLDPFNQLVFIAIIILSILTTILIWRDGKAGAITAFITVGLSICFFGFNLDIIFHGLGTILVNVGWIVLLIAGIMKLVKK